jgi:membrane-associated protease RseP (regulator of RpoE activity)
MPANVIEFVLTARNQASPEFRRVAADVTAVGEATARATRSTDVVRWGQAWGTAATTVEAGTTRAGGALATLDAAAKSAARGGMAELLAQIPVLGPALGHLVTAAGGFTLALGGLVGVGVGVLSFLRSLGDEAGKAQTAVAQLATQIGTTFRATILDVQRLQAEAAGQRLGVIEASFQKELVLAQAARDQRLQLAREELAQASGIWAELTGQRALAEAKFTAEAAAAESALAQATILAHARKNAALQKLDQERADFARTLTQAVQAAEAEATALVLRSQGLQLAALQTTTEQQRAVLAQAHQERLRQLDQLGLAARDAWERRRQIEAEFQARVVALEQQAADQRRQIIDGLTTSALTIVQSLGDRFAGITEKLSVAQFVQQTQAAMQTLRGMIEALENGDQTLQQVGLTTQELTQGIQALTTQMQEAIAKGHVPTQQAAAATADALADLGAAAVDAGEQWLRSLEGISTALDAIIAKTRQARQTMGTLGSQQTTTSGTAAGQTTTTPGGGGGMVIDVSSLLQTISRIAEPFRAGGVVPAYRQGGVVHELRRARVGAAIPAGEVPIFATPGEIVDQPRRVIQRLEEAQRQLDRERGLASGARRGDGRTVIVHPGAVTVHLRGSVIRAARDFDTLLAIAGERLARRLAEA